MSAEREMDEATYDDTAGATFDGEEGDQEPAPYLVPRLAAFAASPSPSSSSPSSASRSVSSRGGRDDRDAEEDHTIDLSRRRDTQWSRTRESGERSAAHAPEDDAAEGVAVRPDEDARQPPVTVAEEDEAPTLVADAAPDPFVADMRTEDVDVEESCDEDVDYADDEDAGEGAPRSGTGLQALSEWQQQQRPAGAGSSASGYVNAFAHSRVKELLKYEGSSSIISKDAASAACEAVALLTRDLVTVAAAEAARRHRKTVTYDDVARVAQLLDRFSFLADVVPPVPAPASTLATGTSIVVGDRVRSSATAEANHAARPHSNSHVRGRSAHARVGGGPAGGNGASPPAASTTRSTTAHTRGGVPALHPLPGTGLRQATLRF
ncbi:hypothetical protein NESM_000131700 [Novymonas esmeraldas]|uniref:Transcription factor CBF/NF-Y/archaeal histone domain-containing protein n=1 Tax=Novymonas esmeraldas TaxID=1808958 RepID=A0AAW0F4P8_9TRYP